MMYAPPPPPQLQCIYKTELSQTTQKSFHHEARAVLFRVCGHHSFDFYSPRNIIGEICWKPKDTFRRLLYLVDRTEKKTGTVTGRPQRRRKQKLMGQPTQQRLTSTKNLTTCIPCSHVTYAIRERTTHDARTFPGRRSKVSVGGVWLYERLEHIVGTA
ncbi:unnamed protein product [Xylocopa violacea]|uniref:Uncharacterized protein n=1 Tax=Xylocopa violacea TaxID=135666 RepID=A0ABP1NBV4_XYLVO